MQYFVINILSKQIKRLHNYQLIIKWENKRKLKIQNKNYKKLYTGAIENKTNRKSPKNV